MIIVMFLLVFWFQIIIQWVLKENFLCRERKNNKQRLYKCFEIKFLLKNKQWLSNDYET